VTAAPMPIHEYQIWGVKGRRSGLWSLSLFDFPGTLLFVNKQVGSNLQEWNGENCV
jgi:hypothetical protein